MPRYYEDGNGAVTQLQVGGLWPKSGGPAYAGSPQGWVFSPDVSWYWYTVDFSVTGGIWTNNLDSCSALVYFFGPANGGATHAALWHVNCSTYGTEHAPGAARDAIGKGALELKYVVIGYNQTKNGVKLTEGVKGSIRTFKQFLSKFGVEDAPWIYVGNSPQFGVDKNGYVGVPRALSIDTVSPRRQTMSYEKVRSTEDEIEQTPICCSKCFITTAVCRSLGLGDDCLPLRMLRAFRDEVLASTSEGRAEIELYYATAPRIVAGIEARAGAADVYARLYAGEILPALAAIERGEFVQARLIYRAMFERLCAAYL